MKIKFSKKVMVVLGMFALIGSIKAADTTSGSDYLKIIAANTTDILNRVDQLPAFIFQMSSLLTVDSGAPTSTIQADFTKIGQYINREPLATLKGLETEVVAPSANYMVCKDPDPFLPNSGFGMACVNDVTFGTLLGDPLSSKDSRTNTNATLNYIKFASGLSIFHEPPRPEWSKRDANALKEYINFYNTMLSVETFGGYALTKIYDNKNPINPFDVGLSAKQAEIVDMITNTKSKFMSSIASEEIGKVLRQILMFQAQTYVLLTDMLKTQKQMLTAQVMSNSLLMLNIKQYERTLVDRASGTPPHR